MNSRHLSQLQLHIHALMVHATKDDKVCIVVCFQEYNNTDKQQICTHTKNMSTVRCVSGTHQVGLSGRFSRCRWAAVEEVVLSLAGGGLLPQLSAMSER